VKVHVVLPCFHEAQPLIESRCGVFLEHLQFHFCVRGAASFEKTAQQNSPDAPVCLPMSWRFRLCRQSFGRWAQHRAARSGAQRRDMRLRTTAVGLRIAYARMFPTGQRSNPAPKTLPLECWRRAEKEIPGRREEHGANRSSCEPTIAQSRWSGQQKQQRRDRSLPSLLCTLRGS